MDILLGLPDWAITTGIAAVGLVVFYVVRQGRGLGVVQMATRTEADKLLSLYEKRIKVLELDNETLTDQIRFLSSENTDLRRRIKKLEDFGSENGDN